MLDGDHLIAANPPAPDPLEHLHSTIVLLVTHHRRFGYRHFVINHLWTSPAELSDLRERLKGMDEDFRSFLLTLPVAENLRRIEARASVRALDERDHDRDAFREESTALANRQDLGEPFDVSDPPSVLVEKMLRKLS